MNITLTPESASFVTQQIQQGLYPTANDVVEEALRLFREREERRQQRLEEMRREIAIGIEAAEQSRVVPLSAMETLARIRRDRQAQGKTND